MIRRYNLPLTSPHCMQPNDAGEYVRYEDHAAEVERLSTEGLHHVALILAAHNELPDLLAELRTLRARVAELERDARLGAVVRAEVAYTNTYGHAPALVLAARAAGAGARGDYAIGYLLRAIADALRAEGGGEHG